ncbi:MAG: L-threonylcarbamoyladenylate synthase [Bacteroidales bacterium]
MVLKIFDKGLQTKQIQHIISCIRNGGIIIYPTDTIYGIGTGLSNIKSLDRIAQLKSKRKEDLNYTLLCHNLSQLSNFSNPISNSLFRFMKAHTPGPYTFILEANNEVPRLFQSKKKQIGIRVPAHPMLRQIIEALGEPLLNTSIDSEDDNSPEYITDPEYIHDKFGKKVDLVIDGGIGMIQYSTILDCTQEEIQIIRQGIGIL